MNISLTAIKNSIVSFLKRYHFVIVIVYIVGSSSYAILLISKTIELSDDTNGYTSQENVTTFDEDTITRLRNLKTGDQDTEKLPVSGRVSPF